RHGGALERALEPVCSGLARAGWRLAANRVRRRLVLVALEVTFPIASVMAAVSIVSSGTDGDWSPRLLVAALILTAAQLLAGVVTGAFAGRWRFVGIRDAAAMVRSALLAGAVGAILLQWLQLVDTGLRLVAAD